MSSPVYEFVVACTVKCGRGWQLPERIWSDHRIVIVRGGSGELRHDGVSYPLSRGSVVFGLPSECYAVTQNERRRLVISVLRFTAYKKRDASGVRLSCYRTAICTQPVGFPLIEQLAIQLTHSVPVTPAVATGLSAALLPALLWLIRIDGTTVDQSTPSALAMQDLKPALEMMRSEGREPKIGILARACGLSPETFRRRMHAYASRAPKQYALQLRLDHAKTLLLESSFSVEAIAESLGYSEPAHFSRQFKAHTGVSPRDFRASYQ